ncbi:MAG: hypothetical protein ACKOWG_19760, partial [Planctomycetia bacterium]
MRTLFRRRAFTLVVAVAAAWPQAGQAVNAQAEKTAADLDAEWSAVAAGLGRRCGAGGHDRLAAVIGGGPVPDEGDREGSLAFAAG